MTRPQMTTDRLTRALTDLALADSRRLLADVLAVTGRTRQRRRWTMSMWWLPQGDGRPIAARRAWLAVAATLLLLGALLLAAVAGGALRREPILRPYRGEFQPSAPLLLARTGPVAVPLGDGHVLIAGGEDAQRSTTLSAEVYDPTLGVSTAVGDLLWPSRLGVRLSDGRALLLGDSTDAQSRFTGQVFDPSTGAFSALPALQLADDISSLLALDDDRVLVIDFGMKGVRVFDARNGSLTDRLPIPASAPVNLDIAWSGVALADGRVLLVPEVGGPMVLLDPLARRLSPTSVAAPVKPCTSVLPDGRVLLLGQSSFIAGDARPVGLIYNPSTDTATNLASAPVANGVCVPLRDGRVLVVAQGASDGGVTTDTVIFDPAQRAFESPGAGRTSREGIEVVGLADGDVLLIGGWTDTRSQAPVSLVEEFR
jgi:hypothetical protein